MLRHYVLTLSGGAESLVDALASDPASGAARRSFRELQLQARSTNSNPIYLGGSDAVSSTDYGVRINTPPSSVPDPPVVLGSYDDGPLRLEEVWVVGTAGEHLHILGVEF